MTSLRCAQSGVVRGCCLLIVLVVAVLGASAFIADRALAAPSLGATPAGPDHGESEAAIALTLGAQLAAELLAQPDGVVTLSEHDLTVLARAHNPHPNSLRNVSARVRDGLVVVEAEHHYGPFTVMPVARISVALSTAASAPLIATHMVELDVGELTLPGFIRDRLVGSLAPALSVNPLFARSAAMRALRAYLECVVVAQDGVRIGVHRPGTTPQPSVCGA